MRLPVLVERFARRPLRMLIAVFVVAMALGVLGPHALRDPIVATFRTVFAPYRELPVPHLFLFILLHNVVASLAVVVLGVVFGILPVVSIAANGILLGAVGADAAGRLGIGAVLLRVAPHGVFELPALFIAATYGLWLGAPARTPAADEPVGLGHRFRHALWRFAVVVLPLLVLAAAIEAFVTRSFVTPR